jgi:hypothetical protein
MVSVLALTPLSMPFLRFIFPFFGHFLTVERQLPLILLSSGAIEGTPLLWGRHRPLELHAHHQPFETYVPLLTAWGT